MHSQADRTSTADPFTIPDPIESLKLNCRRLLKLDALLEAELIPTHNSKQTNNIRQSVLILPSKLSIQTVNSRCQTRSVKPKNSLKNSTTMSSLENIATI